MLDSPLAGLRGDYRRSRADFALDQDWGAYTAADHAMWRRLFTRQERLIADRAAPEFIAALRELEARDGVPDLARASATLHAATGWRLVGVPGLIPDLAFFRHLSARRFPVTTWLRRPDEADYLVEPDIFHDFFGHVPMLMDPVFADFMQAYGRAGIAAEAAGALKPLARLYWYTVEFGLIDTSAGLRAYGAGILSSAAETTYALEDRRPLRLAFDRARVLGTDYRIDDFQASYFVIDGFKQLFDAIDGDLVMLCREAAAHRPIAADSILASDRLFH